MIPILHPFTAQASALLNDPRVQLAKMFAYGAHLGIDHVRKFRIPQEPRPYTVHLDAVALLVACLPGATVEMVMAAYLHDVVEDTGVVMQKIIDLFGETVGLYVYFLTDVSKKEDGSRAFRKNLDLQHVALAPVCVKSIKLCDSYDNLKDIVVNDKNFAPTYAKEKIVLLKEALHDADPVMFQACMTTIDNFRSSYVPSSRSKGKSRGRKKADRTF